MERGEKEKEGRGVEGKGKKRIDAGERREKMKGGKRGEGIRGERV